MKTLLLTILMIGFVNVSYTQSIKSGEYDFGLKLAFDSNSKKITGYFENYSGYDEETKNPRFSCIFYIEGTVTSNIFKVLTYYPEGKYEDTITGHIEIVNDTTIKIKLPSEHGGCWNVQNFADEWVKFGIDNKTRWTQIRYIVTDKSYFYSDTLESKKKKAYIVKNDFVCVHKTVSEWTYCSFFRSGYIETKGWIKSVDLNTVE